MTEAEKNQILELAHTFWSKSSGSDLELLGKKILIYPFGRVKSVMESVAFEHSFSTMPRKLISDKLKTIPREKAVDGSVSSMFALCTETGRWHEVAGCNTTEGIRQWLECSGYNSNDYRIYSDEHKFRRDRFEIKRMIDPSVGVAYDLIGKTRNIAGMVVDSLPAFGEDYNG